MKGRWLGYPLLALALLIAVFTAANITFAERPEDCAPEDREIEGNTNSPCKWDYHLNEITSVRYSVAENTEGNTCHEVLVFSPYDSSWDLAPDPYIHLSMGKKDEKGGIILHPYVINEPESVGVSEKSITIIPGHSYPGAVKFYSIDSSVPLGSEWGTIYLRQQQRPERYYQGDFHVLQLGSSNKLGINTESSWLPMPANIADFNLLMNDCLAGINQRLENEAKLEEARQKVEAERVAQERAAKQAAAEAERQRLETEAAREALRIARVTELAKTQALIEQLEREKIIIGIWQEIVDEKLAGAKARADITNTYLTEIEANAAVFKASVVAKAAQVRRLQEINDAIADAIIAHNDEILVLPSGLPLKV